MRFLFLSLMLLNVQAFGAEDDLASVASSVSMHSVGSLEDERVVAHYGIVFGNSRAESTKTVCIHSDNTIEDVQAYCAAHNLRSYDSLGFIQMDDDPTIEFEELFRTLKGFMSPLHTLLIDNVSAILDDEKFASVMTMAGGIKHLVLNRHKLTPDFFSFFNNTELVRSLESLDLSGSNLILPNPSWFSRLFQRWHSNPHGLSPMLYPPKGLTEKIRIAIGMDPEKTIPITEEDLKLAQKILPREVLAKQLAPFFVPRTIGLKYCCGGKEYEGEFVLGTEGFFGSRCLYSFRRLKTPA